MSETTSVIGSLIKAVEDRDVAALEVGLKRAAELKMDGKDHHTIIVAQETLKSVRVEQINEEVEVLRYFLQQAMDTKSRELLEAGLEQLKVYKAAKAGRILPSFLVDLEQQATELQTQLYHAHIETTEFFLSQSIEVNDMTSFEEAFAQAMSIEKDINPELIKQAHLHVKLSEQRQVALRSVTTALAVEDPSYLEKTVNEAKALGVSRHSPLIVTARRKLSTWSRQNRRLSTLFVRSTWLVPVFGSELLAQAEVGYKGIPIVLIDCVEYLIRNHGVTTQGIFRVPGNSIQVKAIQLQYETRSNVIFKTNNNAASVFKAYLRELTEPLISFVNYPKFLAQANEAWDQNSVEAVAQVLEQLPESCLRVLGYVMTFLHYVASKHVENSMTSQNLAICFTPNILRPRQETMVTAMKELPLTQGLIRFMIEHSEEFFSNLHIPTIPDPPDAKAAPMVGNNAPGTPAPTTQALSHTNTPQAKTKPDKLPQIPQTTTSLEHKAKAKVDSITKEKMELKQPRNQPLEQEKRTTSKEEDRTGLSDPPRGEVKQLDANTQRMTQESKEQQPKVKENKPTHLNNKISVRQDNSKTAEPGPGPEEATISKPPPLLTSTPTPVRPVSVVSPKLTVTDRFKTTIEIPFMHPEDSPKVKINPKQPQVSTHVHGAAYESEEATTDLEYHGTFKREPSMSDSVIALGDYSPIRRISLSTITGEDSDDFSKFR